MKIWTPRELARALELRMQGIPWKDTAKELGRSESSVWVKLHGLGIKLRPDGNNKEAVRENLIRLHREFVEKAEATETSAPVVESEKPESAGGNSSKLPASQTMPGLRYPVESAT
jgi:hypothetical protein